MTKKKNNNEATEMTADIANEPKTTKITLTAATREELDEKVAEMTADGSYMVGCVGRNCETGQFVVKIERKN